PVTDLARSIDAVGAGRTGAKAERKGEHEACSHTPHRLLLERWLPRTADRRAVCHKPRGENTAARLRARFPAHKSQQENTDDLPARLFRHTRRAPWPSRRRQPSTAARSLTKSASTGCASSAARTLGRAASAACFATAAAPARRSRSCPTSRAAAAPGP